MRSRLLISVLVSALAAPSPAHAQDLAGSPEVRMALVLPLSGPNARENSNMLDFYCGVLTAAREAGTEGVKVDLAVKDFSADSTLLEDLDSCEFILGPVRCEDLSEVLTMYPGKTVISPLDQRAEYLAKSSAGLVQMPPHARAQFKEAVGWAQQIHSGSGDELPANFILVTCDSDYETSLEASYALKESAVQYKSCKCSVQGEIEGWEEAYNPLMQNYVILAITNEAALNNAVRNMSIEVAKDNVISFAPSKIRSYTSIPLENIHRAGIHAVCSYYVDQDDELTQEFIETYTGKFGTYPSQYAFQGYDIALFAIRSFAKYGAVSFRDSIISQYREDLLQSSIKLSPLPGGGLVNEAVRRVEYRRDYSISLSE